MCKACGNKYHFVMAAPDKWEAEIKRIAKLLHSGKLKPGDVDPVMIKKIAQVLMGGVFEGYGKNFDDKLTIEEFGTLKALERNIYVFSGFKNEKQLRETALFLKDDDGNIKPFKSFLNDVKAVNSTYNEAYLSAEYSNTIASAQAISFWQESERNKEHVKNLTWRTAGDSKVRPDHAVLDGLTRPKDDDFWKTHFIPLDWGCRCDIEESNEPVTDIPEVLPNVPPMFRNNVGISGIIFPETHPYFENAGKELKQKIEKVVNGMLDPEYTPQGIDEYAKSLDISINKEIFDYLDSPIEFRTGSTGGAYYDTENRFVYIPIDDRRKQSKWKAESVIYHEFGHAADWANNLKNDKRVVNLMNKYREILGADNNRLFRQIAKRVDDMGYWAYSRKHYDLMNKCAATSDTIMSLNPKFGMGHNATYWKIKGRKEAEFLAHTFENKFAGNELFKKVLPDLYKEMLKLADDLHPLKQE